MQQISITDFRVVKNHPYLKALANLTIGGMHLRGLRLEERGRGELTLGFPGRKIQGSWQVIYEPDDRRTERELLEALDRRYREVGTAA